MRINNYREDNDVQTELRVDKKKKTEDIVVMRNFVIILHQFVIILRHFVILELRKCGLNDRKQGLSHHLQICARFNYKVAQLQNYKVAQKLQSYT